MENLNTSAVALPRRRESSACHRIRRRQFLPIPRQEAWAFFSSAVNLARITPSYMGFRIRHMHPPGGIQEGQRITYTVRPLLGLPLTWLTGITRVEAARTFTDEQLKGPYKLWRHRHSFEEVPGGTVVCDEVEYQMPFGVLGELVHRLVVRRRLEQIFDHRQRTLQALFPVPCNLG
ncbi:MAG: SRPBCC family protein [Flavobacteriales bacterium]|nr:SRPBCC family protein [Flavobacteriales bacterium]